MENADLEALRQKLFTRREELEAVIRRENEQLRQQLGAAGAGEEHVDFNHPADMVGGDPDYEKELTLLEGDDRELAAVDKALDRMASGAYEYCEECGQKISLQRLQAVPYTSHCRDCQELLDQEQRKILRTQRRQS